MSLRGARSIIGGWPRIGTGIERVHFDSPAIVGLGTSWPLGRHDTAEQARGVGCPLDTNPCARRRTSRVWSALAAAPRFSTDVDGRLSGRGSKLVPPLETFTQWLVARALPAQCRAWGKKQHEVDGFQTRVVNLSRA